MLSVRANDQNNSYEDARKKLEARVLSEGRDLWKRQQEFQKMRKQQEQKEMRELLGYWPWNRANDAKPRGLRNLRLEELFPNQDYEKAKRFVGQLDLGRPGGGAPNFRCGKKLTTTKEDPLLRFQFGSKDLRKCVDNNLRYKTNKEEQQEYKKALDKLVEEKKQQKKIEDEKEQQLNQDQTWSQDQETQKKDTSARRSNAKKNWDNKMKPDILLQPSRNSYVTYNLLKPRKLTPLSEHNDSGVELAKLMVEKQKNYSNRKHDLRIPLCSSDITGFDKFSKKALWYRQGSAYLKELTHQILQKQERLKEMKAKEIETVRHHFSTLDGFWGRPGHGAPHRDEYFKKQSIDRLLYPPMVPISVH